MAKPTAELKSFGEELGFQSLGVAAAGPAETMESYTDWLSAGFGGEMAYLARHAAAKADPRSLLPSAMSVIAVALPYNQPDPWEPGQPRIARYALGRDYHRVLRGKLKRLASWIAEREPSADCRPCVDSAPILEREFSHRAGLGWQGKNTCLIDSKRGSWFFIGLLLTSVEYEPDAIAEGGCGTCRACIDACPTGAIVQLNGRWQVDSRRCISYLTIEKRGEFEPWESEAIGEWTFGCDVCQSVCPFNSERESQPLRAAETRVPDFRAARRWPSLTELAVIQEPEWDTLTQGSPIRRAGPDGLRRNAKANLQNQSSRRER
jgi:epoxyqueuosine reductase